MSARGVDYESINITEDSEGRKALESLGASGVPVVARGDDFIYSQDLNQLAQFAGIDYRAVPELSPGELVTRLTRVLYVAGNSIRQLPAEHLNDRLPGRDRTCQALANHIFEIAAGFVRVANGEDFTGRVAEAVPDKELSPSELGAYCTDIQSDLNRWWQAVADPDCQRVVNTFYGQQSLHAVLERCTWHVTQHIRQLMMVLEMHNVTPEVPLTDADLAGLPLPENVWDG